MAAEEDGGPSNVMSPRRKRIRRYGAPLATLILLVMWEFGVRYFNVSRFILPAPTEIAALIIAEWHLVWGHLVATTSVLLLGYVCGSLVSFLLVAVMIRFTVVEDVMMPLIVGLQSVPKIALAPLILIWIGTGLESKTLIVASISFFPILINTMTGFKEVDRDLLHVFRSVAATERQIFFSLRLPYALPYIFSGLKIATTLAVIGAIAAEWVAASDGLGYMVLSGSVYMNSARSLAAVLLLGVLGVAFFGAVSFVERKYSWKNNA